MKEISFSNQIFENHLNQISKISERDIFDKKIRSLYSWLEWLKKRGGISQTQYNSSIKRINDIKLLNFPKNQVGDNFENSSYISDNYKNSIFNYKFFTLLIILSLFLFNIYIYKLYSSLSSKLEIKPTQGRVLPFKGSIKQTDGKPLDTKRDAIFNLYNVAEGGSPVYTGKCVGESGLEPDFNGAFTILVGSDCGMKPIPEYIFQENSTLYLGMNIGSDIELTPRYQIFTTTYSKDTSKLQGLEPGKKSSSIPYIDEKGRIQIDSDSPVIESTNGTFAIEGKTLSLKAGDSTNGDILIQPGSESNVIIPFGKLGLGIFKPTSIIDIVGTQLFKSVASIKNLAIPDDENTSALRLSLGTKDGVKSNFIEFFSGATMESDGEKVGDIRLNNDGVVYETAGADFAEYFILPKEQQAPPTGTIISLSSKGIRPAIENEKIIGAVSTSAGFIGNRKDQQSNMVLIGLVGQLNVLVSTVNGELTVGSRLGSTTIPGYGGVVPSEKSSVGYIIEKKSDDQFTNEKCPKSYKSLRDPSNKKVRCGIVKVLIDLE